MSINVTAYSALVVAPNDWTAAIAAADAAAATAHDRLFFPSGTYGINASGVLQTCTWFGEGRSLSTLKALAVTLANDTGIVSASSQSWIEFLHMGIDISSATLPPGSGNPGNIYFMYNSTLGTNWSVKHCLFSGIKPQVEALLVNGGSNFVIEDNDFDMPTPSGSYNQAINISISAGSVGAHSVIGNRMNGTALMSNGGSGLYQGNAVQNWKFGAGLTFGPEASGIFNRILDNLCVGGVGTDINDTCPPGIECWSPYSIIANNHCYNNSGDGIRIGGQRSIVRGNFCLNNGQTNGSGIGAYSIPSALATSIIVGGNQCFDNQTTKTQTYGYAEYIVGGPGIVANMIEGNNFDDNKTGTMLLAGSMVTFRGPKFFVATGADPGTLAAGASTIGSYGIGGAEPGDIVTVSYAADLQGCNVTGYVPSAGTVNVMFSNCNNVGAKTLSLAALNIWIDKPVGYASIA